MLSFLKIDESNYDDFGGKSVVIGMESYTYSNIIYFKIIYLHFVTLIILVFIDILVDIMKDLETVDGQDNISMNMVILILKNVLNSS